jgi:hypothetical protein
LAYQVYLELSEKDTEYIPEVDHVILQKDGCVVDSLKAHQKVKTMELRIPDFNALISLIDRLSIQNAKLADFENAIEYDKWRRYDNCVDTGGGAGRLRCSVLLAEKGH